MTDVLLRAVLRIPLLGGAVRAYRCVAFDLPRLTTGVGVCLLLGIAAIRLFLLADGGPPAYLGGYFALVGALAVAAAAGMVTAGRPGLVRAGWALGSVVALGSLVMYIVSRTLTLPGLPQLAGRWDYAPGTLAMALSGTFLVLHFAVLTGRTVAYPHHQHWHD